MTIALLLNKGTGTFFENANKSSTKAPDLVGFVEFVLDKEKSQSLRLEAAIWLKMKDGKKFYSASIGGIPATMFIEEKQSEQAPDYAGSFGFGREMRIAGWKNQASVMKSRTSASQFQNAQWGQKAPLALMNSLHNRRHRLQANPIRHNRHISLNPNRINTQAE